MSEGDPPNTQRCLASPAAELTGTGFDDAREIGRGGFGVVYRCTQAHLDRTVAVKVLTTELDDESRERFFREQRAMGRLTGHPNIVNILEVGTTASARPYIVMPHHSRDSLDSLLRRDGPLVLSEALHVGVKMAGAVESAHRLGVLHRDVKPANILLNDYGEPELADFGIAHISGGFTTATGAVTGSPAYTAPEVLAGDPPSAAADVYSLGATLFSLLTGHAAFERRNGEQVVAQFLRITTQPPPDLREHGIPDDVSALITHAMCRSPGQRPATVADFGEELRKLQRNHGFAVDEMALRVDSSDPPKTRAAGRGDFHRLPDAAPTGKLPIDLSSFVGRRRELTETKNLLVESRLVTLTGIGGVGKTRLALRAARSVQRQYDDGAWLVELSELHDESLLVDTVASALGFQLHSAPSRQALEKYLETRQILLVLDNCEHLVRATAELVGTLLRACPRLRILATSREPLGVSGEAVLIVPALNIPDPERPSSLQGLPQYDAVTLFVERATASVPGFVVTEDNAAAVAGICQRLEGLPLPIELAAARLRALSPEQILGRMTDRYTLLTRGSRGVPTRQQTLQWCIDWSYELCTGPEQRLWESLAVFAGSFELDAAEQVCRTELISEGLVDTLMSLVDKSILIREEAGSAVRFRILETLRDYGYSKLSPDEVLLLRRRHRDWYATLVRDMEATWISARQLQWIARLKREQSNIREALEFCIEDDPGAGLHIAAPLFVFWTSQGLYSEGRRWLGRLLSRNSVPPVERIKALYGASVMAEAQGDLQTAADLVEEGRMLSAQTGDPTINAFAAFAGGMFALFSGDPVCAYSALENALVEFSKCDDRTQEVGILYPLGMAYELCGMTNQAIECLQRVLALTDDQGEEIYRAHSLWALGIAVWQQGETDRSVHLVEESLRLARHVHSPRVATACLEALAWFAYDLHNAPQAATLMGAAAELARSMGSSPVVHSNLVVHHQTCEQKVHQELGNKAFRAAHSKGGNLDFDAAIAYALHEQPTKAPRLAGRPARLTKRERQVADLIAEGLTNQAIATRLVISLRTVQGHVEHILAKLGFASRTQVAAWVVEQGHD